MRGKLPMSVSNANTAASIYYSFYVRAQRRYANGLTLLASYTGSRSEPGLFSRDFSVNKAFTIREKIKDQFRAEALNATNTPLFGNPGTTPTNSTFGAISSQINYPRLVQLGLG